MSAPEGGMTITRGAGDGTRFLASGDHLRRGVGKHRGGGAVGASTSLGNQIVSQRRRKRPPVDDRRPCAVAATAGLAPAPRRRSLAPLRCVALGRRSRRAERHTMVAFYWIVHAAVCES